MTQDRSVQLSGRKKIVYQNTSLSPLSPTKPDDGVNLIYLAPITKPLDRRPRLHPSDLCRCSSHAVVVDVVAEGLGLGLRPQTAIFPAGPISEG